MNKRGFKIIASLLTVVMILAGCGSGGGNAGEGSAPVGIDKSGENGGNSGQDTITLRVGYFAGAQATVDVTNKVIALFEKKYPNIKIESEYSPFANYFEKLSVQAAGNTMPDVVRQDYMYLAQYANKNLLMNLDGLVQQGKINLDGVDNQYLEGGMVDGNLYGVNIGNNANVTYYDPEAFTKAGIPLPAEDWTWEQYEQTVNQLHEKLGIYGDMHLGLNTFQIYLRQHGASLYSVDGTALGYEDDNLFSEFHDMQLRLQKNKAISPIAEELEAKSAEDTPFAKGKSVMDNQSWSNNLAVREKITGKTLNMAVIPGSSNGRGLFFKPSQFMSISKNAKYPEEAAKFIDFWMNDIEANQALNATLGFPYIPKVLEAMTPNFDEAQKKTAAYLQTVAKYASPISPPEPANSSEVSKLYENIRTEIFFEKLAPQEAGVKFRMQANEVLAKNKK